MNPTPEEFEQFEKEAWRPFAESYAPTLSPDRRYSDMLRGWLTAHRARAGEVERLRRIVSDIETIREGDIDLTAREALIRTGSDFDLRRISEKIKSLTDAALATTPADSKSYPDDHGQYESTCVRCGHSFLGGKGRLSCRECADGSGVLPHNSQVRALRRMVNRHCGEPFTGILDQLIGHTKNQSTPDSGVPKLKDDLYILYFDDTDRDYQIFTTPEHANKAFLMSCDQWSCHLFKRIKSSLADDYHGGKRPQADLGGYDAAGEQGGES